MPSSAKYDTSQYIGAELPNLGVLVNEFNDVNRDTLNIYLGSYAPTGTPGVCVPVQITEMAAKPRLTMILAL